MRIRQIAVILLLASLLLACGNPRSSSKKIVPRNHPFPTAEIPAMLTDPQDRMAWLSDHYWDAFTRTDQLSYCDTGLVNGVLLEDLEEQMGIFTTLLHQLPLNRGVQAMQRFYARLDAFQTAFPESNVFPELSALASRYLYDPNSPVRSEDLYRPFVEALSQSRWVPEERRPGYAWDAQMCALNAVGTKAADFPFIDSQGRRRTLYSIKADITLLIFGHPDCTACRELVVTMNQYPELLDRIGIGELRVVDVYIDEDLDAWKQHVNDYPQAWINGYDPDFRIRTELLYHVRAVPSLYLLDRDKTVLMKDATPEDVLDALL